MMRKPPEDLHRVCWSASDAASGSRSLVAVVVADSCYHAASTPSRPRVIHPHHHSVVIVGITCAWVFLGLRRLLLRGTLKQRVSGPPAQQPGRGRWRGRRGLWRDGRRGRRSSSFERRRGSPRSLAPGGAAAGRALTRAGVSGCWCSARTTQHRRQIAEGLIRALAGERARNTREAGPRVGIRPLESTPGFR